MPILIRNLKFLKTSLLVKMSLLEALIASTRDYWRWTVKLLLQQEHLPELTICSDSFEPVDELSTKLKLLKLHYKVLLPLSDWPVNLVEECCAISSEGDSAKGGLLDEHLQIF